MEVMALPIVKMLLVAIIFFALLVEIKTGGIGLGALFGLIGAGVFFGSQFIHGLVSLYEVALFLGGVLFIVIELLTPSIGIFAGLGIFAILYSFMLALGGDAHALYLMGASLALAIGFFVAIFKRLPSSKLWSKIILNDMSSSQKGYVSTQDYSFLLGKEGVVLTELRPSGAVKIDGDQFDVVSEGRYIEKNKVVKVVAVHGVRIVVKQVDA